MAKTRKTYITSRKEIDRLVAEAIDYTRTHKGPAVLRGIRFPKGYSFKDFGMVDENTVMFVDCDLRGLYFDSYWCSVLVCKNCDVRGQKLNEFYTLCMSGCDMRNCDMRSMDFVFRHGNGLGSVYDVLRDCDLRGADFSGCDFDGIGERSKLYKQLEKLIPMACPAKGKYTAYKRLTGGWVAELEIPAHAKRSSATNKGKCRASEAVVKRIYQRLGRKVITKTRGESIRGGLIYFVGKTVKPDGFDNNRFHVCAPGIHHFMTAKEAEDYQL